MVDLEQQYVVDLLPGRTAPTITAWLQCHLQVEMISRDRGGAYTDGASIGAIHAIQAVDYGSWYSSRS